MFRLNISHNFLPSNKPSHPGCCTIWRLAIFAFNYMCLLFPLHSCWPPPCFPHQILLIHLSKTKWEPISHNGLGKQIVNQKSSQNLNQKMLWEPLTARNREYYCLYSPRARGRKWIREKGFLIFKCRMGDSRKMFLLHLFDKTLLKTFLYNKYYAKHWG